jgi:hypothetical protein
MPDSIVLEAKRKALDEGTTLTALIIQGLQERVRKGKKDGPLPVSGQVGGLRDGIAWTDLAAQDEDWHR